MNLILFLLLALTASRTGLAVEVGTPQPEGEEDPKNNGDVAGSGDESIQGSDKETNSTTETDPENLVIMIIIPLVLTLVIIAVIVCVVMIYRRGRIKVAGTKEDPYLDHEDHEKVPMPMFDDDIPSVMELEMEDLENWISKDGGKKVDTGQI